MVVDNLQFWGNYFMGREHVQLLYQNTLRKWERDRTIVTMKLRGICECFLNRLLVWIESVNFLFNMNGIYECFLYCLLIWMESLNVFLIVCLNEWNLRIYFIICWHEWNMWMFYYLFIYMNGICECFLYCSLYEWNLWMFSSLFIYVNGICECFLYCLFIRMESVNVFFNC